MNLILSIIALALGPVLYSLVRNTQVARSSLDGFLFVTIAGIVVVHIVPDVVEVAGLPAIMFVVLGALFALGVERFPAAQSAQGYSWVAMIGALGLALHAAMDGIALLPGDLLHAGDGIDGALRDAAGHEHSHSAVPHDHSGAEHDHDAHDDESSLLDVGGLLNNHLALGVILHRIPVGMAIWWTLRPLVGSAVALGTLGLIAFSTAAAYLFGEPVIELLNTGGAAYFQAFVAGTLLHVIVSAKIQQQTDGMSVTSSYSLTGDRLGILAGLFLVYLVPHAH